MIRRVKRKSVSNVCEIRTLDDGGRDSLRNVCVLTLLHTADSVAYSRHESVKPYAGAEILDFS